ncbi:hypothetical protein J6590_085633 [Homalodisca vitripennis]|nr:hypothetical protein J6590_085633 [Homalodisca vitripennis]
MHYLSSLLRNTRAVATTPSTAPPGPDTPTSGLPTASASTSVPDTPPALDTPCTPCTGPAYSTPGQVSVLTVTPSGGLPSGPPKTPDDLVDEIFILRKRQNTSKRVSRIAEPHNRIRYSFAPVHRGDLHGQQLASRQPDRPRFRDSGLRDTVRAPARPTGGFRASRGRLCNAEAVRIYPVLNSGDKSGSAAAVAQGVNLGQTASMSPGVESLAGATEASEHISPTMRQTDS